MSFVMQLRPKHAETPAMRGPSLLFHGHGEAITQVILEGDRLKLGFRDEPSARKFLLQMQLENVPERIAGQAMGNTVLVASRHAKALIGHLTATESEFRLKPQFAQRVLEKMEERNAPELVCSF